MAAPVTPVLIGLMAWGVYSRVRRNIGQQPLRPRRIIVSIVMLSLVTVLLILAALPFPKMLLGISGGLALGIPLGFFGLRLTKFETTDKGHFYTPNTHIGVALSLLLIGRMLYRFWVMHDAVATAAPGQPQLFQSPLTYFIIGLTFGYYLVYHAGLFVHTHDKSKAAP